MARATKERLAADAVRFGLGRGISAPAVEAKGKYDATPCVSCGRLLGQHTRSEIHDCAMARS